MKGRYCITLVFLLIIAISPAYAQIELSSGVDMGYPLMLNKYNNSINYGQISFGVKLGISYKPQGTQFFPTLNYSVGHTRLPLQQIGNNVVGENFNYQNLMLNGNFVVTFSNQSSIYILGGIGYSELVRSSTTISGKNGDASAVSVDSLSNITKFFPAIGLGVEYVYGDAVNQKVYMSLGLSCQYIIFLANDNYYRLTVEDYNKQATLEYNTYLAGHAIVPNFNITLHYLLGKEIIFWKKYDSRYE